MKTPAQSIFGLFKSLGAGLDCSQPKFSSARTTESISLGDGSVVTICTNSSNSTCMIAPADKNCPLVTSCDKRCKYIMCNSWLEPRHMLTTVASYNSPNFCAPAFCHSQTALMSKQNPASGTMHLSSAAHCPTNPLNLKRNPNQDNYNEESTLP